MIDGDHFLFLITIAILMSLVNKYMMELMMEENKSIRQWFDHITTFLPLETKPFNFNGKGHGYYNVKKMFMSSYGFSRENFCCFLSKFMRPVLDDEPNRNNPHFHVFALSCSFFFPNCPPNFTSIFSVSYCEVVSVPDTALCSTVVLWCLKELKKPCVFWYLKMVSSITVPL